MRRRDFLLAAAASGIAAPALAFERQGKQRILVFSGGQPVPVLDPHVRYDYSTRLMQQSIYDALAKYVDNPAKIVPWLAQSWEANADSSVWTFRLVTNAKFHNGDPLDAEAVRWSFERGLKLNKGVAWMLTDHLDPSGIAVVDPHTIRFTLKQPFPGFLSFLPCWFIVNPKQVQAHAEGDDYGQKWLTTNEAGSGPFKINRWDPQAVMALDAVPDYWKGWPMPEADRPAGVILRVIREGAPRKAALQRGEVDMVTDLTPDDYDQLAKLPGIKVTDDVGMTPFTVVMNTANGPTADLNFRKAVAYAMDYKAVMEIENNEATLMTSPFPNAVAGYVKVADMPTQDLAKAKEYLAKTPYANGGIELEYLYVAGLEVERRVGLALLNSLQPLGIKVNVVAQPWPTVVGRGTNPDTTAAFTAVYVTPVTTDPDVVASQYANTAEGQYWGIHHLKDAELDRMIPLARVEPDHAKRMAMYADIQKRIVALQPSIFCVMENRRWAMRDYVKGFVYCPVRLTGEVDFFPIYIDA
jgi:peptide/nickel transport system substrate-binding protein